MTIVFKTAGHRKKQLIFNAYTYYLISKTFMNYGFGSVPENFVDFSCLESSNAFGTFQKVADAKKKECVVHKVV